MALRALNLTRNPQVLIVKTLATCATINDGTLIKAFCTSPILRKVIPKKKGKSSHDWLTRQLNDPYVKLAKFDQYRARSAYKLREIDDRHKFLCPGQVVVECGAAPGAWTQVAISRINSMPKDENRPQGMMIGVDLLPIQPLPGATLLSGADFTLPETQEQITNLLNGKKVDVVLSDMAPNATGTKSLDHDLIMALAYSALRFAIHNSGRNATFLCKVWEGHRDKKLLEDLEKFYNSVKIIKPPSSRSNSSEKFAFARGFK
ncbi:unnamed protein product, partial [Meganyctiphanes norvegica]